MHEHADGDLKELRSTLLGWYRAHARDLPWRRTRDPYSIWVSEVMLQQTRVDTVKPYFERFMNRWPSVVALAQADPGDVRAAWSGLGYYRRAQSMLEAAAILAHESDGRFPSDPETLAQLPGFGRYTSGAVASIAFDRPVPAVDGNVSRVLARWGGIEGPVVQGQGSRQVWDLATRLAPGEAPGEFNQALIELGALVCKRKPNCPVCPIRKDCKARLQGRQGEIPPPRPRPEKKEILLTALVLHNADSVGLTLRPQQGLFGGMYCPPLLDGRLEPVEAKKAAEHALGIRVRALEPRGQLTHVLTHRRIEAQVLCGPLPRSLPTGWERASFQDLESRGLPSFAVKLLRRGVPSRSLPDRLPGRSEPSSEQIELPLAQSGEPEM